MIVKEFSDGIVINGDCTDQSVIDYLSQYAKYDLIVTDPPYGKITKDDWDNSIQDESDFTNWMLSWTNAHLKLLKDGGSYYVWGGIGVYKFRPFLNYMARVEHDCQPIEISNLITWGKKRAYGLKYNYLFTREECLFMVKGDRKHPKCFNIPLLEKERGYEGYNSKYPAKSKFLRRTNVWSDISEIFKGKLHPTEKPAKLQDVIISTSSREGDVVLDPFAGSGTTGIAARKAGRKFALVEQDQEYYKLILSRLENQPIKTKTNPFLNKLQGV